MTAHQPSATTASPQATSQAVPHPGYVSPIPVVRTHLGHAVASEWTKIKSVRSTLWTLGVFLLIVIGLGLVLTLFLASADANLEGNQPLQLGFPGLLVGSMCVVTLGVLTTASEYGTGMIRTTMTACPSRVRILTAKAIVFFALAFTVTLAATTFVAFVQTSLLRNEGLAEPTAMEWLKGTVGVSLYVALLGLLSLAAGSVIRHSAGAITLMIGLLLAPLVIAMFLFSDSLRGLQEALVEYSIPNQLSIFYDNSLSDTGTSGWDPLWIMLVVAGASFGCACSLLERRDV
ncbi:hypothetical protein OK074_0852 [Actinobacteria bacterium OK074]|nr:hypothetical protein OK074_0852 [Actinobacteria bacterium OK074]